MTVKEKFVILANAYADDHDGPDVLKIILSDIQAGSDYVNVVVQKECAAPIAMLTYEADEICDKITELDERRTAAHERAIIGVKRLNRFAEMKLRSTLTRWTTLQTMKGFL